MFEPHFGDIGEKGEHRSACRECLPSTKWMCFRFDSGRVPYRGWVCCWFLPCSGFFFSRFSSFPPSIKTKISKFQFSQDREPAWKPAKADVAPFLNYCNNYYNIVMLLSTRFVNHSSQWHYNIWHVMHWLTQNIHLLQNSVVCNLPKSVRFWVWMNFKETLIL